jgi:hypothetical protein
MAMLPEDIRAEITEQVLTAARLAIGTPEQEHSLAIPIGIAIPIEDGDERRVLYIIVVCAE